MVILCCMLFVFWAFYYTFYFLLQKVHKQLKRSTKFAILYFYGIQLYKSCILIDTKLVWWNGVLQ